MSSEKSDNTNKESPEISDNTNREMIFYLFLGYYIYNFIHKKNGLFERFDESSEHFDGES